MVGNSYKKYSYEEAHKWEKLGVSEPYHSARKG